MYVLVSYLHVYFRIPRSSLGYGSSRNAMTSHDSRGPYSSSRQGMDYGGGLFDNSLLWLNIQQYCVEMQTLTWLCCFTSGSYSSSDVGGMYSSSYGSEPPRRDVSSSYGSDIPPRRDVSGFRNILVFSFLLES